MNTSHGVSIIPTKGADTVSNPGGIINMRRIFLAFIVSVASLSCDGDSDVCGVADPVRDLAWLRAEIDNLELDRGFDPFYQYRFIAQGYYNGKTVFFQSRCCPICSSILVVTLKNCAGEPIGEYDPAKGKIKFQKTIWRAEGFPEEARCDD